MNGYCTLEPSSPPVVAVATGKTRRSLELTNTKETKAWEGLAIGAVTLARTFSTGSQRFCRSGSQRSTRGGNGLPGALRRAFSMRRPPAGPSNMGDGYWRIHHMDRDSDHGGDDSTITTLEEQAEEAEAEEVEKKNENHDKEEDDKREEGVTPSVAVKDDDDVNIRNNKKKRSGIFKACKKLLRL